MQLLHSTPIKLNNMWEPDMFGLFSRSDNGVIFLCKCGSTLYAFVEGQSQPDFLLSFSGSMRLPLPRNWVQAESSGSSFLLLSNTMGVNLASKQLFFPLSDDLHSEYIKKYIPSKHFDEDSFCFDDYCISHKGMSGYKCEKQGNTIWTFQGRAYLHTEIEQYHDHIFFGTAGSGGYFYVLDVNTGKTVASIKTGGTRCIERVDNRCYFLQRAGKTSVLCVDLQNGQIIDQIVLPGKASDYSRLCIVDNRLHSITFQSRDGRLSHAFWNIVQL